MNVRILVVEDEAGLVMALQDRLENEGYSVETTGDGLDAETRIRAGGYDGIVLDVMLPGRDGFQVCRNVRNSGNDVPILMLTARSTNIDVVMGLKLGADDYLPKPFDMQVLLARLEAMIRRSKRAPRAGTTPGTVYTFDDFELDTDRHVLLRGGAPVPLNAAEYRLLAYLVGHHGAIVSRDQLLDDVWGYESDVTTRTVDVHVARLRQKLGESALPRHLKTIRGLGYRFDLS